MCVENSLTYDDVKSFSIITEDEHRRAEPNTGPPNGETFGILIFTTNRVPELDLSGLHQLVGGDQIRDLHEF